MKDDNLIIAEIAASIVTDCLGESLTANTYYSADGNFIIMAFGGYPLRGSDRAGNVYVQFPRNTFYKKRGNVHFTPIYQSQCRYYQESIGNQLAHPHVYIDGHPSWDNTRRETPADFLTNVIETLSLQNVTEESIEIGHCSSAIMGISKDALKNSQEQKNRVINVLKCNPIILNHEKLKRYVNQSWCDKLMTFFNGGVGTKVVFENLLGITVVCEIDMADSPIDIVRKFCEDDPKIAVQFFASAYAFSRFIKLDFAESVMVNSCFELLTIDGDTIKANWKSALLNQLEIKEAMENIVNEDQIPTFVVWVEPTCVA